MLNALPDRRQSEELLSEVFLPHRELTLRGRPQVHTIGEEVYIINRSVHPVEKMSSETTEPQTSAEGTPASPSRIHLLAECVAEFLGTAILVLVGCASVAEYVLSRGERASFLSVNFAFGFGAMIAVYVAGPVSGAHINPAVSIAMLTIRSITWLQCLTYILAQFMGALIAAALVFGVYFDAINDFDGGRRQVVGSQSTAGIFGTLPTEGIGSVSLFFDQVISTALLLIAVCSFSNKRNKLVSNAHIPLAVGFVIVAIGLSFGYNCGFPINPARDFAPRLLTYMAGYGPEVFTVSNYYFWIPCIGPIVGALIGTWLYQGYDKLVKIHVGEKEKDILHRRRQLDQHNANRL